MIRNLLLVLVYASCSYLVIKNKKVIDGIEDAKEMLESKIKEYGNIKSAGRIPTKHDTVSISSEA